jgi:hypothetical protein
MPLPGNVCFPPPPEGSLDSANRGYTELAKIYLTTPKKSDLYQQTPNILPILLRRNAIQGDDDLKARVSAVLKRIDDVGLDLPIFLDTLSWGCDAIAGDSATRYQRSLLMKSVELPQIIDRWEEVKAGATRSGDMTAGILEKQPCESVPEVPRNLPESVWVAGPAVLLLIPSTGSSHLHHSNNLTSRGPFYPKKTHSFRILLDSQPQPAENEKVVLYPMDTTKNSPSKQGVSATPRSKRRALKPFTLSTICSGSTVVRMKMNSSPCRRFWIEKRGRRSTFSTTSRSSRILCPPVSHYCSCSAAALHGRGLRTSSSACPGSRRMSFSSSGELPSRIHPFKQG